MYITDEEVEQKIAVGGVNFIPLNNAGRGSSKNLSAEFREIIGKTAALLSPKEAAEAFGVNEQTALAAKNGMIGTNGNSRHKDPELAKKVESAKEALEDKVNDLALNRLLSSLEVITPEKLEELGVKDAAEVAVKMNAIAKSRSDSGEKNAIAQVFIHMPAQKREDDYDVVVVDAEPV